ncbi:MerR family transcriptional regulator [Anaerovibrio sp.]|uniref:MerR family transcriptional regulator n=1 Tax=Anaerovibrio sp. TaxID=1872532 RepID=UPI003F16AEC1
MYTMKQVCQEAGLTYETLKFYCNQGLVPNVKRDKNNRRIFDDYDLAWIKSLICLKKCELSIAEMKEYLAMCLEGPASIPRRKKMLTEKQAQLHAKITSLQEASNYIDWKHGFYDDVLSGKIPYTSNLLPPADEELWEAGE